MERTYITEQQIELLKDAYESTLGTSNYTKYSCEWHFKSKKTGKWKFSIHSSPCPYKKAYFKKVRDELYLYNEDGDERTLLNDDCKELLDIK